jgi:hypothetical protein
MWDSEVSCLGELVSSVMRDKGERIRGKKEIKVVFDVVSVTVFFSVGEDG